jgi:hypothetical protein
MYSSRLVIADLSLPNPNVYYELGVAHTLGKKAVLLTQKDPEKLPFDLRQLRIINYSDDERGHRILRSELKAHVDAILEEPIDEIYQLKTIAGGYVVESAKLRIELDQDDPSSGTVLDTMRIVGTRENVVLVNKIIDHPGELREVTCNHRFVRSTEYPNRLRIAALFDPPYVQVGTRLEVDFGMTVTKGFVEDRQRWEYDIAVDAEVLEIEFVTPGSFSQAVRLSEYVAPNAHEIRVLLPSQEGGRRVYRARLEHPEVGKRFLLSWS